MGRFAEPPPLKKSEAEAQMESNFGKMRTIAGGWFDPTVISPRKRDEVVSYYEAHKGQARELLEKGQSIREQGEEMSQGAVRELNRTPRVIEDVYAVGVAGLMTTLAPLGNLILEDKITGTVLKELVKFLTGDELKGATIEEIKQMMPDVLHMIKVTAQAYEALGKAYEKYRAVLKDTYEAYQKAVELKNAGDEAGAEKAIVVLNQKIQKLEQAKENLTSAINTANEAGNAYLGAQGVADTFVCDSAVTVVTSVVAGPLVKKGVEAGAAAVGKLAGKAAQAVKGAEAAAGAARTVEQTAVVAGEASYETYDTVSDINQASKKAAKDREVQTACSSSPNYQI